MGRLGQVTTESLVNQPGCWTSSWGSHGVPESMEGRRLIPQSGAAGRLSQL